MAIHITNNASHSPFVSRRGAIQAGAAGLLGLGLGELWRLQSLGAEATGKFPKAKSVIYIFLAGGLSQID